MASPQYEQLRKALQPGLAAAIGPGRFDDEVRIAARLSHPHILALLDSGEADGLRYYVMPYLGGETLRQRLDRGVPVPVAAAISLLRDIADALDHAHADALTPAEVLTELARHIFEVVYAESSVALHRVLIAERTQFPELAETFYRVGPGATRLRLAEYLARETARGRLKAPEPDVAAEHFLGMLVGHSYMRRLLGLETALTEQAKARRIEAAVSKFLRAYAA